MDQANVGIEQIKQYVDSLIIVSNNQLLNVIGKIPMQESFKEADNVLRQGVQTITDLIAVPAFINLDFADIKSVMAGKGTALIGIGMAQGENKAKEAAARAIRSPLLEANIKGAKSAIINITGGPNISLQDSSIAVDFIKEAAGKAKVKAEELKEKAPEKFAEMKADIKEAADKAKTTIDNFVSKKDGEKKA